MTATVSLDLLRALDHHTPIARGDRVTVRDLDGREHTGVVTKVTPDCIHLDFNDAEIIA